MKRLNTDVIHLYFQDRVDPLVPIEETVGAIARLVEQGKVAHVWAERVAMAEAADGNPWVVQLHHAWCSAEYVYLVMEYVPGGDLMSLLMKRDTLPEPSVRRRLQRVEGPSEAL